MKGSENIKKAKVCAAAREKKRTPRMKVSGKSVFSIAKIKDKNKK